METHCESGVLLASSGEREGKGATKHAPVLGAGPVKADPVQSAPVVEALDRKQQLNWEEPSLPNRVACPQAPSLTSCPSEHPLRAPFLNRPSHTANMRQLIGLSGH